MYKKTEKGRNLHRVERLIENMPLQIAENLYAYFQDYKDGKITRKELAKRMQGGVMINIESTCNGIDGMMNREIKLQAFTCMLRDRKSGKFI